MMEKNIGKTDKIVRAVIAIAFAYAGYRYSAWFYLIALVIAITIATGFCWFYKIAGINTANKYHKKK